MIEIYIDDRKLDLKEDIDVNFTYTSLDTMNPSAVKNSFSKTVSIPSTPNNDEIFGHIWRFDSYITSSNPTNYTGVYFDPHKRTPFYIMRNGAVVENGYCVLESISMIENEKTYKLNLFGGLGEFFFNLMYDEDGKEKNLTDLYWKWIPMLSYDSLDWEDDPLTEDEENSSVLYRLNSANVCASWPMFDPNENLAYDSKSFICSDIMFVPMYYGYNKDFISNKILVNDYQRKNSGSTAIQIQWNKYLPVQYQEDNETYELYEEDTDNKYGLLETPRDLDPTEARDFRVTNMPMAIRLSKLMNRISDPANNGGYTVIWDNKIKESYWWKYGFILTDTPEYDLSKVEEANYNLSNMTLSDEWRYTTAGGGIYSYSHTDEVSETISSAASTTNMSVPKFFLKVKPEFTFRGHKNQNDVSKIASLGSLCLSSQGNVLKSSNALCWLVDFFDDDDTYRYSHLCVASFSNTSEHFGSPYYISNTSYTSGYPSSTSNMTTKILDYVNTRFSRSLTSSNYTLKDSIRVKKTGSTSINSYGSYYYYKISNVDEHVNFSFDIPTTITNMKVKVTTFELNYYYEVNNSTITDYVLGRTSSDLTTLYLKINTLFGLTLTNRFNFLTMFGYKIDNDAAGAGSCYKALGYAMTTGGGEGPNIRNYYGGTTVTSKYTAYLYEGAEITSYLDIYKKTLLNNTKSPYTYLIDFAKMLNLRFLYDKHEKKITIMPHNRYWINKTIDINGKVDVGREINVKHLFDKTKFIKLNLDTPDTWAETIYKKLSKYEYGEYIKDTGIQFNKESKNLLDGLIYSNSILWQNKSIYYDNSNIGYYYLPTPINQNVFDWTLFKVDGSETKTLTRSQGGTDKKNVNDGLPKIGSFDKDNKSVSIGTSFVFYNGLVQNFTITNITGGSFGTNQLSPNFTVSDNTRIQQQLAGGYCYYYGFKNDGTSFGTGVACKGCSASWYVPYFSRDLYNTYKSSTNTWKQENSLQASWDITMPENVLYDESNLKFITYKTDYDFPSTAVNNVLPFHDYTKSTGSYIVGNFWADYINDFYDRNSKEITCYCKIDEEPELALRKFYSFRGSLWIMTKIENYKLNFYEDNFSKVTLHKVRNKNNYLWRYKLTPEEQQAIVDQNIPEEQ